jgi:lipoprotein-anchoring transpeptidase ErfK/SrfK
MSLRFLTAFSLAASVFLGAAGGASANPVVNNNDPEGRFSGGMTEKQRARLFGPSIRRTQVAYPSKLPAGSIVVNTTERRLYLILGEGQALRYGIGVGRDGFTWAGDMTVTLKKEWPDWTPPPQMLKRRPDLPRFMKGGEDNPLGARAMYLGSSLFRIHGTSEPETIGEAVSSGCFRLVNEDVIDLYNRVKIGARVVVQR